MWNSSISPIDMTLSGANYPDQITPGIDGNEGVLCIPQSSSITEASSLDSEVSYTGHSLWGGLLFPCRDAAGVFYSPSRLGFNSSFFRLLFFW